MIRGNVRVVSPMIKAGYEIANQWRGLALGQSGEASEGELIWTETQMTPRSQPAM